MTTATPSTPMSEDQQHEADLMAMVEEIGTAVATGLVPFLGQAVNIYDTIESLLTLHDSVGAEAQAEAKFDLVLALVGWIPGAGGGVKKTIRIVNKNPERYAPILFDVLRMVCTKLGIQTSPESLLDKLFDATGLKATLETAQSSIEQSWAYEQMPTEGQQALSSAMATVRASLPAMLMLVTVKLTRWKRVQRNTAARNHGTHKKDPGAHKPAAADPAVAKSGTNTPQPVGGNSSGNAEIGTAALTEITNELVGILGEHITDYFLYEEYGWGKGWRAHDQGISGSWETRPGKDFPGKLNAGTKLNPLFSSPHGVGIDGVWKVQLGDPHNGGKPYAIVESKASSNANAPSNPSRKPQIRGKLLTNARRIKKAEAAVKAALPKMTELLDPPTTTQSAASGPKTSPAKPTGSMRIKRGQRNKRVQQPAPNSNAGENAPALPNAEKPLVQMSHNWITKNIASALKYPVIELEFRRKGEKIYDRHLFYTPFYLPSANQHVLALRAGASASAAMQHDHTDHSIPSTHRHSELEVKNAVNSKHKLLSLPLEF